MSHRLPAAIARLLAVRRWSEDDARQVLDAVASSGLTCAEFARAHDLSAQRLYVWQRRLTGTPPAAERAATAPVRFVEVHDPAPVGPGAGRVEIVWAAGPVVRIEGPVDEETLRAVLRVVRESHAC